MHESRFKSVASKIHTDKSVIVILAYFNGSKYIREQIESIFSQSHSNLKVCIFDDNSDISPYDALSSIPNEWKKRLSVAQNDKTYGFCANFLKALATVDDSYKYYSFSDQDDAWHADKISRALNLLSQYPSEKPALYCARTEIFDDSFQMHLGFSPLFQTPPSFANALVQSIGGGNTMVFNKAARDLIVASSQDVDVISHDWWCYLIVSGSGGIVHYDPDPCLMYRQHDGNLMGSNNSWRSRAVRARGLLRGKFRHWNDANLKSLSKKTHLLTPENKKILNDFILARNSNLFKRIALIRRCRIYRQTLIDNIGLFIGIIFNKV